MSIKSMTGMGSARGVVDDSTYSFEIRSVNHRYCEVFVKLPTRLQSLEYLIIQHVKKKIQRGKIDVWLQLEEKGARLPNSKALKNYRDFILSIKKELKLEGPLTLDHILQSSSLWMDRSLDAEKLWLPLKKILDTALDKLIAMRAAEGKRLIQQIRSHLKLVEKFHERIQKQAPQIVANYQKKLQGRVQTLLNGIQMDPQRLAQEVALTADRCDITEELERLTSHFVQMKKVLDEGKPCGRTLDFLIQEMNREWNTVGSKSPDTTVAHDIVNAKSEMERMREQVQNIE